MMFEPDRYTGAPTKTEMDEVADIQSHLGPALDALKAVVDTDVANLNKALNDAGVPRIVVLPPAPQQRAAEAGDGEATDQDPEPK